MDRQNRRVPLALWSPGQKEVLGSELSCPTYRPARGSGCLSLTQNTGRENTHTPSRSSPHTHTHHRHSLAHTCTHTRKYPYAHASHIAHSPSTPPHTHTQSTRRHHTLTPHTHTHAHTHTRKTLPSHRCVGLPSGLFMATPGKVDVKHLYFIFRKPEPVSRAFPLADFKTVCRWSFQLT